MHACKPCDLATLSHLHSMAGTVDIGTGLVICHISCVSLYYYYQLSQLARHCMEGESVTAHHKLYTTSLFALTKSSNVLRNAEREVIHLQLTNCSDNVLSLFRHWFSHMILKIRNIIFNVMCLQDCFDSSHMASTQKLSYWH